MPYDLAHSTVLVLIVGLSAAAQSAVGFGIALFAMPPLLYVGLDLPSAIVVVAVASYMQSLLGVWRLRQATPWRTAVTASAVSTLAVIAGFIILKRLTRLDLGLVKLTVGGILCLLALSQMSTRPQAHARVHWAWAAGAFLASGLLSGICGMGGPPLVLWSLAHDWTTAKTKGFLFAVSIVTIPIQLILLRVMLARGIAGPLLLGLALTPATVLGAYVGLALSQHMSKRVLRLSGYVMLLAIGVAAMAPPLLARLR